MADFILLSFNMCHLTMENYNVRLRCRPLPRRELVFSFRRVNRPPSLLRCHLFDLERHFPFVKPAVTYRLLDLSLGD